MYAEFHLSPKVLLGVHVGCGGEGVIEEDESVSVHVEGQVGTRGQNINLSTCIWRAGEHQVSPGIEQTGGINRRSEAATAALNNKTGFFRCSDRIHRGSSPGELQNAADSPSSPLLLGLGGGDWRTWRKPTPGNGRTGKLSTGITCQNPAQNLLVLRQM